ncbi:helix-turn-helix transcriptional regulator [Alkalilacustris brevis]|uniref:helix-turn-helix transcriptional regulator n=1 Tax=Alkalilacustris brevis TaxID=2026338 RepID=UPI000E0D42C3|nr:helix-turn-helix transcriptional regulator [Alkalilacustris brevis]
MTGNQLRAARALAGLDQSHLAESAGVSVNTIRNLEGAGAGLVKSRMDTVHKLVAALEAAGVVFLPENGNGPGVALRKE